MHLDAYCQTCYHVYHLTCVACDLNYHACHSIYCACLVLCHAYPWIHHLYRTYRACQLMHRANDLLIMCLLSRACCAWVLVSCPGMHVWTNCVTRLWGPCLSVQLACALPCHEKGAAAHADLMLQRKVALHLSNHWSPTV